MSLIIFKSNLKLKKYMTIKIIKIINALNYLFIFLNFKNNLKF